MYTAWFCCAAKKYNNLHTFGVDSHTCDNFKECALSADGEPECVCKSTTECPSEASPVCASNGHMYRSECHMNARLCHDCVSFHCVVYVN